MENVSPICHLNVPTLKKAIVTLRAVNHKIRLQILHLINEKGKINVTDIYVQLRLDQTITSLHLQALRHANVVIGTRKGKNIYYSLNKNRIAEISNSIDKFLLKS